MVSWFDFFIISFDFAMGYVWLMDGYGSGLDLPSSFLCSAAIVAVAEGLVLFSVQSDDCTLLLADQFLISEIGRGNGAGRFLWCCLLLVERNEAEHVKSKSF